MDCAVCGFANDPSASVCARCNATLTAPAFVPAGPAPTTPMVYPGAPQPSGPPRRNPLVPILVGVAVVLFLAVIGVGVLLFRQGRGGDPVALPSITVTTTPAGQAGTAPPTARQQAEAIDAILDRSAASRAKLNQAIDKVNRCTRLDAALADMRSVGDERNAQIADLDAADVSAIDSGELRSTLKSALQAALGADQQFVAWAEPTVKGGCAETPARKAAYAKSQAFSKQAQAAKKKFVALWNPVATPLGFEARTTQYI
ncbi:hypothetical protein ACQP2F_29445 [Actinoplanes sp. CA-030573]|uniref:hypothetical protein n=1 Tax=Actinoplanes sp. CA-030573 TaxID=3239898 RepID=UPI003D8B18F1